MAAEGLAEALAELADGPADVQGAKSGTTTDYARAGTIFALASEDAVELRLAADIADAARRTPDTTASDRGDEWVRFSPRSLDGHARDRLAAWFLIAYRLAEEDRRT
jgi:hypothetical protein